VEVFLPASTRVRHRINAHRTHTNIHAFSGIRTHERAKTFRALDRAATAIGNVQILNAQTSLISVAHQNHHNVQSSKPETDSILLLDCIYRT
jgi:hypothetical protein